MRSIYLSIDKLSYLGVGVSYEILLHPVGQRAEQPGLGEPVPRHLWQREDDNDDIIKTDYPFLQFPFQFFIALK